MKHPARLLLVAALTAVSLAAATSASASPVSVSEAGAPSTALVQTTTAGPIRVVESATQLPAGGTSYVVGSGSVVTVVPEKAAAAGVVSPQFSVGVGWGVYIYLNRIDQGAVATGAAAGLAVAICAIPAVNTFGCAAVAAVLATAAFYIAAYGMCPSRMEINMPSGNIKCVK